MPAPACGLANKTLLEEKCEMESKRKGLEEIHKNQEQYHKYIGKMLDREQWICWKYGKVQNGKQTKLPICPINGKSAKTNDPKDWTDFNTAFEMMFNWKYDGIGYVFTDDDGLVGIDLDHCIDNDEAKKVINEFSSYTEYSPSDDGVHIIVEGDLPDWSKNKNTQKGFEVYEKDRFFTFTGYSFGILKWIAKRYSELKRFCKQYLNCHKDISDIPQGKHNHVSMDEDEISERFEAALKDVKFAALHEGNVEVGKDYPSESEADQAYFNKLAFYFDCNPQVMEQIASESKLYREKWDRQDYKDRTIDKAIENTESTFQLPREKAEPQQKQGKTSKFTLVPVGEMQNTYPEWLIEDYLEADSFAMVFGEPGCGKSFLGIDMACCVATGVDFHGLSVKQSPVVYIAGEGQKGIARRMKAWGIRNQKELTQAPLFVSTGPASFCDTDNVEDVKQAVKEVSDNYGKPGLVIVDTLARNFGPGDENSTKDMTAFISAIDEIRTEYNSTVVVIHHTGHNVKERERGSYALRGALDANYRLEKKDNGIINIEAIKMKEAELPQPMAFNLHSVELGMKDERNREVTSAILNSTEYVPGKNVGQFTHREKAVSVLISLYEDKNDNLPANQKGSNSAKVSIDEWRNMCVPEEMTKQRFSEVKKELMNDPQIKTMLK